MGIRCGALRRSEARALLVWRDYFLDLIENLALADRAAGMRTDILIGQHLAADAENADFERFERENPIIPVCDIAQLANRDFFHRILRHSIPDSRGR
jgi:hypothetical protein